MCSWRDLKDDNVRFSERKPACNEYEIDLNRVMAKASPHSRCRIRFGLVLIVFWDWGRSGSGEKGFVVNDRILVRSSLGGFEDSIPKSSLYLLL